MDRETNKHADRHANRQTDRQTNRQGEQKTERQRDKQTDRQTDVSPWSRSIAWLPKRFPETNSLIDILTASVSDMGTVGYSLQQALPSQFTLSSLLSTNKVQQKLTSQSVKSEVQSRIDSTASVREAACLRSLQGKGSGA